MLGTLDSIGLLHLSQLCAFVSTLVRVSQFKAEGWKDDA
jgi:hypothetical protein